MNKQTIQAAKCFARILAEKLEREIEVVPVGETAEFVIQYNDEEYVVTIRHKPIWTMK